MQICDSLHLIQVIHISVGVCGISLKKVWCVSLIQFTELNMLIIDEDLMGCHKAQQMLYNTLLRYLQTHHFQLMQANILSILSIVVCVSWVKNTMANLNANINGSPNMDINLDGLTLEDEGMTLNLDASVQNSIIQDHCLIGRVLSDKEVRLTYFKQRLNTFWRPVKGFDVSPTTENRYLFQFNHKNDAENVMMDRPWTYDNCNLVIERISPGMIPKNVCLDFMNIWVQVHNLPYRFIQPKVGEAIGRYLGELVDYDSKNSVHSMFMSLKVRINVTQPLRQEWQVRATGGEWIQILFKYERLGNFCYACGILGHTDRACEVLYDQEHDDGKRGWSVNLKFEPRKMGTAATNKWLHDNVVGESSGAHKMPTSAVPIEPAAKMNSNSPTAATSTMVTLGGRVTALDKELDSIRSDMFVAHLFVNPLVICAGPSKAGGKKLMLSPASVVRPTVLALKAVPNADEDESPDLRKWKRSVKQPAADSSVDTIMFNAIIDDSQEVENVVNEYSRVQMSISDNPLYENDVLTAGPEHQARREQ